MSEFSQEAAARTMDRMWATAHPEDGRTVLDITLDDTEAIIVEMDAGAPCGVCGQQRCRENRGQGA